MWPHLVEVPLLGSDGRTYHANLRYGIFQRMMKSASGQ
jgi:hypothetical protein